MTHSTVTVVLDGQEAALVLERGESLDGLLTDMLAPFNEELEGPRTVNRTWTWGEEETPFGPDGKAEGMHYVNDELKAANSWESLYLYLREDYGDLIEFDPEARTLTEYTTYNPQSRWDWWTIGGRWEGYFRSKATNGGVNYVLVNDLDLDSMVMDALSESMGRYDEIRTIVGDDAAAEYVPWTWYMAELDAERMDIGQAREAYHTQSARKRIQEAAKQNSQLHFVELDRYMVPRDEFEKRVRDGAIPTYALLGKDGVWSEPGRMGWWGLSDETEATMGEYQKMYMEYIASLDPTDVLVCVDVHI